MGLIEASTDQNINGVFNRATHQLKIEMKRKLFTPPLNLHTFNRGQGTWMIIINTIELIIVNNYKEKLRTYFSVARDKNKILINL